MTLETLSRKRVAVLGSGENHKHLIRYFEKHHISFEVIDQWDKLTDIDVSQFEVVFRTPGIPYLSGPVQDALASGTVIYSQTKLFFDLCAAKIIGVTGTKGKGTTATLIHKILQAAGLKTHLAGNIGLDPFEFLDELTTEDWVILELSSFQLQDLHKSPHIAVVLKITPEHLDYHKKFEEYWQAKSPIVKFQLPEDVAVLNYDNEITRAFAQQTEAKIFWNSIRQEVRPGCFVRGEEIVFTPSPGDGEGGGEVAIMDASDVHLLGRFNLENITAAIAGAHAARISDPQLIKKVVSEFRGLEHRLEFVRETNGVKFYNDSFSTTPETSGAALSAFSAPIILIAGGSEKHADYVDLARTIAGSHVTALLAIGTTGPKIAQAARVAGYGGKIYDTGLSDMSAIVAQAASLAHPGDVVLLSPASASFDMFANYKQRGELFKKFVNKLTLPDLAKLDKKRGRQSGP